MPVNVKGAIIDYTLKTRDRVEVTLLHFSLFDSLQSQVDFVVTITAPSRA